MCQVQDGNEHGHQRVYSKGWSVRECVYGHACVLMVKAPGTKGAFSSVSRRQWWEPITRREEKVWGASSGPDYMFKVLMQEFCEVFQGLQSRWWACESVLKVDVEPAGSGEDILHEEAGGCSYVLPSCSSIRSTGSPWIMVVTAAACCLYLLAKFNIISLRFNSRHELSGQSTDSWRSGLWEEDCIVGIFNQVGMGFCGSAVRAALRGHNPEVSK